MRNDALEPAHGCHPPQEHRVEAAERVIWLWSATVVLLSSCPLILVSCSAVCVVHRHASVVELSLPQCGQLSLHIYTYTSMMAPSTSAASRHLPRHLPRHPSASLISPPRSTSYYGAKGGRRAEGGNRELGVICLGIGICTNSTGVLVNLVLLVLCANRHGAVGAVGSVAVVQWCRGQRI